MSILDLFRKKKKPPAMTLSAVVHRADGTVEDLGVIASGDMDFTPKGAPDGKGKDNER